MINYDEIFDDTKDIVETYRGEYNDNITRDKIINHIRAYLRPLYEYGSIYDFLVICDETNNTPERIARNELWVEIVVQEADDVSATMIPIRTKL